MIFSNFPQHFSPTLLCRVMFILTGLLRLTMQTLKKQEETEDSFRSNVYNAKFSLKTRLEHGFAIDYTYFQ